MVRMSEPPGVTLLNQRRTAFVLRYPRTRRRAVTRPTLYFVGRRGFTEPTREPPPQSGDRGPSSRRRMTAICGYRSLMGQGRETLLGVDALGMPAFSPRSFGA